MRRASDKPKKRRMRIDPSLFAGLLGQKTLDIEGIDWDGVSGLLFEPERALG